jgi:hypothetical protein
MPKSKYISFGLILALNLSLFATTDDQRSSRRQIRTSPELSRNPTKVKLTINEIITTVWLIYAICYKDYIVMSICVAILLYTTNSN